MDNTDINEKIEDGSYFKDAYEWYERKYLSPLFERIWMTVAMVICVAALLLQLSNITDIWNNVSEPAIVVTSENSTDYFSRIQDIALEDTPAQESVTIYLLSYYLQMRENYDPRKSGAGYLRQSLRRVRSSSSKNVLREYQSFMSANNPYSPLNRYGKLIKRDTIVTEVSFLNNNPFSGKAEIRFTASEKKGNNPPVVSQWLAKIHYRLPDVNIVSQTGAPLRFVVRHYRVKPL
jgi:type IV secretory pathway component VirB8